MLSISSAIQKYLRVFRGYFGAKFAKRTQIRVVYIKIRSAKMADSGEIAIKPQNY